MSAYWAFTVCTNWGCRDEWGFWPPANRPLAHKHSMTLIYILGIQHVCIALGCNIFSLPDQSFWSSLCTGEKSFIQTPAANRLVTLGISISPPPPNSPGSSVLILAGLQQGSGSSSTVLIGQKATDLSRVGVACIGLSAPGRCWDSICLPEIVCW